jgi:hypothetical protein
LVDVVFDSVDPNKQTGDICERNKKAKYNMKHPKWFECCDETSNYIGILFF